MVGRRVPSLPHDMAAALMADLIVAAAIIIHPGSPAPVPPVSTQTDHTLLHTPPSHRRPLHTPRVLVWTLCLHYHPPPRHVNTLKSTIRIPRVSAARHCCGVRLHLNHQLITSPLPSRPRASPPANDHPRAYSPQLILAAN